MLFRATVQTCSYLVYAAVLFLQVGSHYKATVLEDLLLNTKLKRGSNIIVRDQAKEKLQKKLF